MDDLEICKRIAEIEGIDTYIGDDNELRVLNLEGGISILYNPLYDALTWRLMIKHQIRLCWEYDGTWVCFKNGISKQLSKDELSNRSVCLAVIELDKIQKELGEYSD